MESGVVLRICGKRCGQSPFRFDLIVRFAKHRNMCLRLNRNLHFKKTCKSLWHVLHVPAGTPCRFRGRNQFSEPPFFFNSWHMAHSQLEIYIYIY